MGWVWESLEGWRWMVTSAAGYVSRLFFSKVVTKDGVYILDLAAKVDATADYICKVKWGDMGVPPPLGPGGLPRQAAVGEETE